MIRYGKGVGAPGGGQDVRGVCRGAEGIGGAVGALTGQRAVAVAGKHPFIKGVAGLGRLAEADGIAVAAGVGGKGACQRAAVKVHGQRALVGRCRGKREGGIAGEVVVGGKGDRVARYGLCNGHVGIAAGERYGSGIIALGNSHVQSEGVIIADHGSGGGQRRIDNKRLTRVVHKGKRIGLHLPAGIQRGVCRLIPRSGGRAVCRVVLRAARCGIGIKVTKEDVTGACRHGGRRHIVGVGRLYGGGTGNRVFRVLIERYGINVLYAGHVQSYVGGNRIGKRDHVGIGRAFLKRDGCGEPRLFGHHFHRGSGLLITVCHGDFHGDAVGVVIHDHGCGLRGKRFRVDQVGGHGEGQKFTGYGNRVGAGDAGDGDGHDAVGDGGGIIGAAGDGHVDGVHVISRFRRNGERIVRTVCGLLRRADGVAVRRVVDHGDVVDLLRPVRVQRDAAGAYEGIRQGDLIAVFGSCEPTDELVTGAGNGAGLRPLPAVGGGFGLRGGRAAVAVKHDGEGIGGPLRLIVIGTGDGAEGIGIAVQGAGRVGHIITGGESGPARKGIAGTLGYGDGVGAAVNAGAGLRSRAVPCDAVADEDHGAGVLIGVAEDDLHLAGCGRYGEGIGVAVHGVRGRYAGAADFGADEAVNRIRINMEAVQQRDGEGHVAAVRYGALYHRTVITVGGSGERIRGRVAIGGMQQRYAVGIQTGRAELEHDIAVGAVGHGDSDLRAGLDAGERTGARNDPVVQFIIGRLRVARGKLQRKGGGAVVTDGLDVVAVHKGVAVVYHGVTGVRGDDQRSGEGLFGPDRVQINVTIDFVGQVEDIRFGRIGNRRVCGVRKRPADDLIPRTVAEQIGSGGLVGNVISIRARTVVADAHNVMGVIMISYVIVDGRPLGVQRDVGIGRVGIVSVADVRVIACVGIPSFKDVARSVRRGQRDGRGSPLRVDRDGGVLHGGKIDHFLPVVVGICACAVCGAVPAGELPADKNGVVAVIMGSAIIIVCNGVIADIGVLRKRRGCVKHKALIRHRAAFRLRGGAGGAVAVKRHVVTVGLPDGVQRYSIAVGGANILIQRGGIFFGGIRGNVAPAEEVVTSAHECVGAQRQIRIIGLGLRGHGHVRIGVAVAVKRHGIGDGRPLGIQSGFRTLRVCQIHVQRAACGVANTGAAAVGVPAAEDVTGQAGRRSVQRQCGIVGLGFTGGQVGDVVGRVGLVGVVNDRVGHGRPLGIQRVSVDVFIPRGCGSAGVGVVLRTAHCTVGQGIVITAEGVTFALGHAHALGGHIVVIGGRYALRVRRTAVAVQCDRGGVCGPLGVQIDAAARAVGRAAVAGFVAVGAVAVGIPAAEGIARAGGPGQRDAVGSGLPHGVQRKIFVTRVRQAGTVRIGGGGAAHGSGGAADHGIARCGSPTHEIKGHGGGSSTVAGSSIIIIVCNGVGLSVSVGSQGLRFAGRKGLIGHFAGGGGVAVKDHVKGVGVPAGGQRHVAVFAGHGHGQVLGIVRAADAPRAGGVRGDFPTAERITGLGGHGQGLGRIRGDIGQRIDRGVLVHKADGIGDGFPLRIQRELFIVVAAVKGKQVFVGKRIAESDISAAAVRRRVPAGDPIAVPHKALRVRVRADAERVVSHVLVRRGAGSAGAGRVMDGVNVLIPLRLQLGVAVFAGQGRAAVMGSAVGPGALGSGGHKPVAEGITGLAGGCGQRIRGFDIVIHLRDVRAAVRVEGDGVADGLPDCGELYARLGTVGCACRVGTGDQRAVLGPAHKGVGRAGRLRQRDAVGVGLPHGVQVQGVVTRVRQSGTVRIGGVDAAHGGGIAVDGGFAGCQRPAHEAEGHG